MTVVNLSGETVEVENVEYDRGLVDILERAIAAVKRGEVKGLAVIELRSGDDDMDIDTTYQGRRLSLLAGAARLVHRLNSDADAYSVCIGGDPNDTSAA